jgi:phosphoserine phosphatase
VLYYNQEVRMMREKIDENEYKAKYLELKYGVPETTEEEWRDFCFELLLQLMEQNKDILKRLKERDC